MTPVRIQLLYLCLSVFICGSGLADPPPDPKFRHQTIDDKIEIGYGVAAADVDGDKKIDILLADKKQFVWYRNPTWEKFVIAENMTKRDNVCLAAQDLDGDGKCELAVGGDWDPNDRENSGAVFYMIPPEDRTQKWEAVKLHAEPTVHRMRWMKLEEGGAWLIVAPLHGRGNKADAPSKILAYGKPKDVRSEWPTSVLYDKMHATHNMAVAGRDIMFAGREGIVAFRRNLEPGGRIELVTSDPPEGQPAGEIRGRFGMFATIEPMHGNMLAVYDSNHTRYQLTNQLVEGHALAMTNLKDGDKTCHIVVGWRGKGGGVHVFTSLNDAYTKWRESAVDDGGMACEDLCLADLDADGDLDIIASGRATKNVKIYWNETPVAASTGRVNPP
jgi:hypothetical protein